MYDIKNLNIWKDSPGRTDFLRESALKEVSAFGKTISVFTGTALMSRDIGDLGLSVRSYNCLKRCGCNTVGDIVSYGSSDDGKGLMRIRNLGARSGEEILDKILSLQEEMLAQDRLFAGAEKKRVLVRPAGKTMDRDIESFHLSGKTLQSLRACGIRTVRDLYRQDRETEPGWYAVRELFEKISASAGR